MESLTGVCLGKGEAQGSTGAISPLFTQLALTLIHAVTRFLIWPGTPLQRLDGRQGLIAQAGEVVNLVEDDERSGITLDEDFGTALNNFILCCQVCRACP